MIASDDPSLLTIFMVHILYLLQETIRKHMIHQVANLLPLSVPILTILLENAEVVCKNGSYELREIN